MPLYDYRCQQESCNHEFETYHSITSDVLQECPVCHALSLVIVPSIPYAFVRGDARTVAMAAERNTEKLGTYGRQEMWAKDAERKELAKKVAREELASKLPAGAKIPEPAAPSEKWFRPNTTGPIMNLANLNATQTKKYIEKGEV